MKASLLFLVIFLLALSIGGASPAKRSKSKNVKNHYEEADGTGDGDNEWPIHDDLKNFGVPPGFTEAPSNEDNESTTAPGIRHHGKSHRKH